MSYTTGWWFFLGCAAVSFLIGGVGPFLVRPPLGRRGVTLDPNWKPTLVAALPTEPATLLSGVSDVDAFFEALHCSDQQQSALVRHILSALVSQLPTVRGGPVPTRPCLDCGRLTSGSRCRRCAGLVEYRRTKAKRQRRPYTSAERTRRAKAVAEHRAAHGDWCPGWRRPAHDATDLTADHVIAVGAGGAEDGPLEVLCRVCNGRKQDSVDHVARSR